MALTPKQLARDTIEALPEDATLEDIVHRLYVLERVEAGVRDVEAGDTLSHEQVQEEARRWSRSAGRGRRSSTSN
jgi:predicted transcriptional regulator